MPNNSLEAVLRQLLAQLEDKAGEQFRMAELASTGRPIAQARHEGTEEGFLHAYDLVNDLINKHCPAQHK